MTQQLIEIFVSENLISGRANNAEAVQFLDAELSRRGKELADVDRRRAMISQQMMGTLPGTGSLEQRLDSARNEVMALESSLLQARSAMAAMNGQLSVTPAQIPAGVGASMRSINGSPGLRDSFPRRSRAATPKNILM